ncbi:MAG: hypothetical protein PF482_06620 [Desulfobacteraceae bacterium]|jgi:tetratricopeptide (TPR) repeat protein|nr:hypothetical protein [Desulfobacteraceae bacterium]
MKKFAGTLMSFVLVLFLCTSNLWAGDSEIRTDPTERSSMPLTEPEEVITEEVDMVMPVAVVEEVAVESDGVVEDVVVVEPEEVIEEVVAAVEVPVIEPPPAPKDDLTIAAELIDMEGLDNYKKALDLCMAAVKADPNSFKANWMAAQACRKYGMDTQELDLADWKDTCKLYGKKGMAYAEKATALEPKKADGYYWYGMNVGIYADATSIVTALKEGLKDKTQNSFEAAYKIDKKYEQAGPIAALGRFWFVLPWPLNDEDKSLEYYREYMQTEFFAIPDTAQVNVHIAELLMEDSSTEREAKTLLEQVPKLTKKKYWNDKAKALLEDM